MSRRLRLAISQVTGTANENLCLREVRRTISLRGGDNRVDNPACRDSFGFYKIQNGCFKKAKACGTIDIEGSQPPNLNPSKRNETHFLVCAIRFMDLDYRTKRSLSKQKLTTSIFEEAHRERNLPHDFPT